MKHTSKDCVFQLETLCNHAQDVVVGFGKHFQLHLKLLKETVQSRQFNMPMEKNDMKLNLF